MGLVTRVALIDKANNLAPVKKPIFFKLFGSVIGLVHFLRAPAQIADNFVEKLFFAYGNLILAPYLRLFW
jgi:hypothetical protein